MANDTASFFVRHEIVKQRYICCNLLKLRFPPGGNTKLTFSDTLNPSSPAKRAPFLKSVSDNLIDLAFIIPLVCFFEISGGKVQPMPDGSIDLLRCHGPSLNERL